MTDNGTPTTAQARADLAAALDALEDRLNVPKRAKAKLSELKESNPKALVAGAAGAAVAVGLGVWAIVRAVVR